MKNSENKGVLILAPNGGKYGTGHYRRMSLLESALRREGIAVTNVDSIDISGISLAGYRVIVLDRRDDDFPSETREAGQKWIAVDNRGPGRARADIVWDTLPHFDMSVGELGTALNHFIIHPGLLSLKKPSAQWSITRAYSEDIFSGKIHTDLIQRPEAGKMSPEEFIAKLVAAETVSVYFGQTFLEALYLGKKIFLYDISEYHKKLSDWFTAAIKDNPGIVQKLDGGGLDRLTRLIAELFS